MKNEWSNFQVISKKWIFCILINVSISRFQLGIQTRLQGFAVVMIYQNVEAIIIIIEYISIHLMAS